MDRPLLNGIAGGRNTQHHANHDQAKRDFASRLLDLALEGAEAEWLSDEVRASWARTARIAAAQAGQPVLRLAQPS
jgi:hypothetical protein